MEKCTRNRPGRRPAVLPSRIRSGLPLWSAAFAPLAGSAACGGPAFSNGTTTDVKIGALPSGYHTYRVQPISGGLRPGGAGYGYGMGPSKLVPSF